MFRKIIVIIFLFTYSLSQAQSSCSSNGDCNNILTNNTQYCAVSSGVGTCTALSAFSSLGTLPANSYCTAGILSIGQCVQYGTTGCTVGLTTFCSGNTTLSISIPITCLAKPVVANLGQACQTSLGAPVCDSHLVCDQKVCRPTIANGYACTNLGIPCGPNSVCDNGYCLPKFSQSNGSPCSNSLTCASASCVSSRCVPIGAVSCYSNSDCSGMPSLTSTRYCSSQDNKFNTLGYCVSELSNSYQTKFTSCVSNYCYNNYGTAWNDCVYANCMTQFVASQCAAYCPQRPDARYSTLNGDGVFDCQKLTRTIVAPNVCNTIAQFQNCFIPGSAYSTSFNILLFLSTLLIFLM